MQFSTAVRNAIANSVEATIGTSAVLKLYQLTGAAPANCAASITATVLCSITLPVDYLSAAVNGVVSKEGDWFTASALASGTADFFRLFASDGTTCGQQGTVSGTIGGGDMTLVNPVITIGQGVIIDDYSITAPNA